MKSIVIFGAGNVSWHLFSAFARSKKFKIIQVYNYRKKSLEEFNNFVPTTTDLTKVFPADIYLFALKDEAIPLLSGKVVYKEALMVHTSGATPLSVFERFERKGVFYPLQTFSKNKPLDLSTVPICLEAGKEDQLKILEDLAKEVSGKIYRTSSAQRKSLHVAAVFVSNFVNFLYSQGEQICESNEIPFKILLPLIKETAEKVKDLSPFEAQTGPAKRGDLEVINNHLELLGEDQQKIYKLLTQSIQEAHGKEL